MRNIFVLLFVVAFCAFMYHEDTKLIEQIKVNKAKCIAAGGYMSDGAPPKCYAGPKPPQVEIK